MVELVVAVALLGIGIAACVACIGAASHASGRSGEYTAVQLMAREKLAEIQMQGAPEGESQGDFGPERPGYAWRTVAGASDVSGLKEVRLTVLWGDPQNPRGEAFVTLVRGK
jgi:hypothetical protein